MDSDEVDPSVPFGFNDRRGQRQGRIGVDCPPALGGAVALTLWTTRNGQLVAAGLFEEAGHVVEATALES